MSTPVKKKGSQADEEKAIHAEFSSRYQELSAPSSAPVADGLPNPYAALPVLVFDDPAQQVVLLNIAHRQQIPKSKVPAFRVCGAFESLDKLKRHALACGTAAYGGANLIKADVHKKFLICSSLEKQQNPAYVLKKIEDLTQRYTEQLQFHAREFEENQKARQQGKTGLSHVDKTRNKVSSRKELLDKKFDETKDQGTEAGEVSRNVEVRNQAVAVVTIINDTTPAVLNGSEDPEPAVIVWGCFESETLAKHYIYNTGSKFVKDVMLDVVNMYEWVFPTEIQKRVDELTEEYRNPSLNKVMNSRKAQKRAVMSYEEWSRKEGQEPASLEISATKATADSTEVTTSVKKTEDIQVTVSTKDPGAQAEATALPPIATAVEENMSAAKEGDVSAAAKEPSTSVLPPPPTLPVPTAAAALFESADWKPVVSTSVDALYKDVTFKDSSVSAATDPSAEPKKRRGRPRKT